MRHGKLHIWLVEAVCVWGMNLFNPLWEAIASFLWLSSWHPKHLHRTVIVVPQSLIALVSKWTLSSSGLRLCLVLPGELWDLSSEAQMIDAFPFIFFSLIKIICADYRKIRTVQTLKKKPWCICSSRGSEKASMSPWVGFHPNTDLRKWSAELKAIQAPSVMTSLYLLASPQWWMMVFSLKWLITGLSLKNFRWLPWDHIHVAGISSGLIRTRVWTEGLSHARQALNPWAASPGQRSFDSKSYRCFALTCAWVLFQHHFVSTRYDSHTQQVLKPSDDSPFTSVLSWRFNKSQWKFAFCSTSCFSVL